MRSQNKKDLKAPDLAGMDKRRRQDQFSIRRQRREAEISKRRNLDLISTDVSTTTTAPLIPSNIQSLQWELEQKSLLPTYRSFLTGESGTPADRIRALESIRALLCIESDPPIDAVIDAGLVPPIIQVLQDPSCTPKIQYEAAWCITNIACGTSAQTREVVRCGAVQALAGLLRHSVQDIVVQAVWGLGNIAGDCVELRDAVLGAGVLDALLQWAVPAAGQNITLMRNCAWALSNMCRGDPAPNIDVVYPLFSTFLQLLHSPDTEVLRDACTALCSLSDAGDAYISALIDTGLIRRLSELLLHPNVKINSVVVKIMGNVVSGDEYQTQAAINVNVLPGFYMLLSSYNSSVRKDAAWAISNVAAGTPAQIQSLYDSEILKEIIALILSQSEPYEVRKEAGYALTNALTGGMPSKLVVRLIDLGCVKCIDYLLGISEWNLVIAAMDSLIVLLDVCEELGEDDGAMVDGKEGEEDVESVLLDRINESGIIEKLTTLQGAQIELVYTKASMILDTYFEDDEDDDFDMSKSDTATTKIFTFNPQPDSSSSYFFN